ncbi:nudix hydrolase 15, mitochondrial-like isoform X1 [Phragmites australis]|uniref:nudix hydrolase 15, mitochondrial-like isoform X1 n=1 Tax=Phragmites australis TaxID=29695 RepID=UPI002D7790E5|nr:nudix hydrolase 15, mitochondrial-like isoform X1 [Phragmites australis]
MRPFLARVFAFTNFAMASLPTSSYPSRRLAHITRHLNSAASCSGELTSVGAPAAAADAVPARRNPASSKVHAAVLVCLFEDPHSGLRVLLTKRASSLNSHSGEVSLPGGKVEEGDADVKATALREAEEEIGLDPALVSIVTVLEPFLSKNGLNVVPVIGMVSDKALFKPVLNKAEVEDIFDAPLEMFLKDDHRRTKEMNWMGVDIPVQFFDYEAEGKKFVIWGLTAHILTRAAAVIFQRQPPFVELPRPKYSSAPVSCATEPKP